MDNDDGEKELGEEVADAKALAGFVTADEGVNKKKGIDDVENVFYIIRNPSHDGGETGERFTGNVTQESVENEDSAEYGKKEEQGEKEAFHGIVASG